MSWTLSPFTATISRPKHAETTSADLQLRLDELAKQVIAAVPRERISPKLAPNIGLVALNLYAAYRVDDRLSVALPMGAPWYAAKAPRNPILSFRLTVKGAVDGLMQAGFAECVRKGSPWGRTFSLIRATAAIVAFLEFPVPSNDG